MEKNYSTLLLENITNEDIISLLENQQKEGRIIQLHPNGFLQIPLLPGEKRMVNLQLHIWHPKLKRRGKKTYEVHTHAFRIHSKVLIGALCDTTYNVQKSRNGKFIQYKSDGLGNLKITSQTFEMKISQRKTIEAGQSYHIFKKDFHSSNPAKAFTVTIIKKTFIDPQFKSKILAPVTGAKRVEVDRTIDQHFAWNIIDEVIEALKEKPYQ